MASTSPPQPPPLQLIIRFSLPIADLPISISTPKTTTPQTLAHLYIRPHLPSSYTACPLRLIASGALLPPKTPLSTSLRLPKAAPPNNADVKDKGKGKAPFLPPRAPETIYIHCALTTTSTLSPTDLLAEASAASPSTPTSPSHGDLPLPRSNSNSIPLGFDRLASAGLSATEIAALRSQFLSLQSHTHTPDTMPSATELRVLEERWLDNGAFPGGGDGGGDGVGGWEEEGEGQLEDMLWGNVMGFFWAVGSVFWLVREEGVWTRRRKWGVLTGVVANVLVGLLRGS